MNFEYKHLLPQNFSPQSRIWIYQSERLFTGEEMKQVTSLLNHFVSNWKSHGVPVKGFSTILFNRFIIFMADETATGVSGCSTDSSVRIIQSIEKNFKTEMFKRHSLALILNNEITLVSLPEFKTMAASGLINGETFYFNNLAATKNDLENNWIIPVSKSWLANRLPIERKTGLEPATLSLGS